jgi:uncharacterized protein YicC (UPF0701 family)
MKKVKAIIERTSQGTFSSYPDADLEYGIMGIGATAAEAKADLLSSYEEMKEIYQKEGRKFTECKFDFVFDVASFLSYYNLILSLAGLERLTGVSQGQLSHYLNGRKKPGKKTVQKIEERLKTFAEDLSQVEFV